MSALSHTLATIPARRRWIVDDTDDKRHRRSCWSCGGRFGQGWELHRQKDPCGPGLVVCDGCIEAWVSDVDDPRTVTWDGGGPLVAAP